VATYEGYCVKDKKKVQFEGTGMEEEFTLTVESYASAKVEAGGSAREQKKDETCAASSLSLTSRSMASWPAPMGI